MMSRPDQTAARRTRAGDAAISYRQQYRRCGKQNCSRCAPGQPGHGPYWYASWWENGRQRTRYVGKELPPGVEASPGAPAAGSLQVQTLGGFAVRRGETLLPWTGRRAASLFKSLLSAPGYRLTREQAMELLWPEADPELAATNLRTTIHLLRRTLDLPDHGTHLRAEGDLLLLAPAGPEAPPADWLDAATFERLAAGALAGDDPAACRRALVRYTGDYLPEDLYDPWTEPVRGHLQRRRLDLLLHLARLAAAQGELAASEEALREALAIDPGHEDAAAALMSLLAASGREGEALRVYQALATTLEEELDVAPGADVEALRARIIAQRAADPPHQTPATTIPPKNTNLPARLTSFIGRRWEVTEVGELLSRARLVTLTGPGGCGKTRLAVEVAAGLVDRFPDGVWLVELAGVAQPALVPAVVAAVLGVEQQAEALVTDTLCRAWQDNDMVLLLDNCEHLIDACARLAAALLAACPRLRILATSREALSVPGELTYRVPSLAAPDPDSPATPESLASYEAVDLFTARARAQRPDFALTPDNAPAVAQICARLDGLPLAVELAAARLSVLPVEGIARRLDDRFRLLAGGPRTALPRQQTLRATMDWSHSLLTSAEQTLLSRLAVFAGGFTLDAAEAVCAGDPLPAAEILDHLDGLAHKSLLTRDPREGEGRYRMLETVRQYAREKLAETGDEDTVSSRHAAYFVDFAERAAPHLTGPERATWVARLQADLDNIRAAAAWAREAGTASDDARGAAAVELGLRLIASIWRFWMTTGQSTEGRRWLESLIAIDAARVPTSVRAAAYNAAGCLAYGQSEPETAQQHYNRALELRRELGDLAGIAETLNGLGVTSIERGEYGPAARFFEESVRLRFEIGDEAGMQAPLSNLANIAKYHGDYARAVGLYERVLTVQRGLGFVQAVVTCLDNLAQLWAERGDYERARTLNLEGMALAREQGLVGSVANALNTRAAHALEQGSFEDAEEAIAECIELYRSIGDSVSESTALINLAEVALGRGDVGRATTLAGQALSTMRTAGHRRGQAFALSTLSDVARVQGDHDRAERLLEECLELRRDMGDALGTIVTLEGRARLAASREQHQEAIRLYGSAAALRAALGTPLPPYWRSAHEESIRSLRAAVDATTFETLWQEGEEAAPSHLPIVLELARERAPETVPSHRTNY